MIGCNIGKIKKVAYMKQNLSWLAQNDLGKIPKLVFSK